MKHVMTDKREPSTRVHLRPKASKQKKRHVSSLLCILSSPMSTLSWTRSESFSTHRGKSRGGTSRSAVFCAFYTVKLANCTFQNKCSAQNTLWQLQLENHEFSVQVRTRRTRCQLQLKHLNFTLQVSTRSALWRLFRNRT